MLDQAEVVDLIEGALEHTQFSAETTFKGGILSSQISMRNDAPDRRGSRATLSTDGVELFRLRLGSEGEIMEFDHDAAGQRELVRDLVGVAMAYLRGDGVVEEGADRRGKKVRSMVFLVDDREYVLPL